MLDADESSAFDDAARQDPALKQASREIDQLAASIALATTRPVVPSAGHLERIRIRLALPNEERMPRWLGLSGWAAAASLALLLFWQASRPSPDGGQMMAGVREDSPSGHRRVNTVFPPNGAESAAQGSPRSHDAADPAVTKTGESSQVVRRETERLAREIAMLQGQLMSHEQRERSLFRALPGVAMPVIMKMTPPGVVSDPDPALAMNDSPVSQLFTSRQESSNNQDGGLTSDAAAASGPASPPVPGAIPIYDAARDAGTLVLSNLPPAPDGWEYNLWVRAKAGDAPVRVGILPDAGTSPSESFDFSLGKEQVVPVGFILTQDPRNQPGIPNQGNTVLEGPPGKGP